MPIKINNIYRYPVKSLTAEKLSKIELGPGHAILNDRRFGHLLGTTPLTGATTDWMPKTKFLSLVRNERLATLETRFDDNTDVLTIFRRGKQVAHSVLTDNVGRTSIEEFFAAYFGDETKGWPKIVKAAGNHVLSDHITPVLSILNLTSVKDLERVAQSAINPVRFRANLWLHGLEPWEEFNWLGRDIRVETVTLSVTQRIDRCAATNVNPDTAERDRTILKSLQMGFGHIDMGVFARVSVGGTIRLGDTVLRGRPTAA